jgi:hypothetical protein
MDTESPIILSGMAPPKIGRPKGIGKNIKTLNLLKAGDLHSCIFGISRNQMNSIRTTAAQQKIPVLIRKLEDGNYAIWRK